MLGGFFEMPEAGVHDLLNTEEFGSEKIPQIEQALLGSLVQLRKPLVKSLLEIGEAVVIEKDADQNGQRR
jgi:hypothetical protein